MRRLALAFVLAGLVLTAGCRIEDRTPTGTRRDEAAIRAVLAAYYRGLTAGDLAMGRSVFWDSATVELQDTAGAAGWTAFRAADGYFVHLARTRRSDGGAEVRPVRTDFRQQGPIAAVWVSARVLPASSGRESARTDHVVLRRMEDGAWRIVSLVSVPDVARPRR